MNIIKRISILSILLFALSACATAPSDTSGKYNLDDQLEPVTEIVKYNLMSWEVIDSRSFILQTAPSQFYLIVLIRPSDQLPFAETISITNTGDMVKPGYDKVTVYGSPQVDTFVIEKIYKLENREQGNAIKEQLRGR